MKIIGFLLFGLIVGLFARAITPGRQKMGWFATSLLGMGGSFLGGFLSNMLFNRNNASSMTAGFIGSIVGAIIVLFIASKVVAGRASASA